jgi:hypothetical protein
MGLCLDEKTKEIKDEGLQKLDIILVKIKGNFCPYQVWDNEGDLMYGSFRDDNVVDIAKRIKQAYDSGFTSGTKFGEVSCQHKIKSALGLTDE